MSAKRARAAYEADLQAQQSPFVLFGTPLPPVDPDTRDDGSYVPIWKQEVRDLQLAGIDGTAQITIFEEDAMAFWRGCHSR